MNLIQRTWTALARKAQYTAARFIGASITEGISRGPKPRPFRVDQSVKRFSDWVYAATLLNAHAVSAVPLRMYVRKRAGQKGLFQSRPVRSSARRKYLAGDGRHQPSRTVLAKLAQFDADYEEITEPHPALTLLTTCNPWQNGFEMTVLRMLYLQVCGNSYLHPVINKRLGIPSELWVMPAQWMKVIPSRTDFVAGYKYGRAPNDVDFAVDEVGHWKLPNLEDVHYGKGKVEAAWSILGLHESKRVQDQAKFDNFSRPDWIIGLEGASLAALNAVEAKIEEKYSGPHNAGKMLAANGKVTAQALNLPDPEVGDGDKVITELAAVIGVPLSKLLGNDPVKANSETMDAAWKSDVILPYCRQDEEMLNQWYLPLFGIEDDAVLCYDNPVPEDRKFELEERKAAVAGASWKTPNEIRQDDGLEPVEGGDVLFVPTTLIPLGMAGIMGAGGFPMLGPTGQPQAGQQGGTQPQLDANGVPLPLPPADAAGATGAAPPGDGQHIQTTTDTVLNGAQITAALSIVQMVAAGDIPRDAGLGMLQTLFNLTPEKAAQMMGSAGTSTPTTPNPNPRVQAEQQAQADAAAVNLSNGQANVSQGGDGGGTGTDSSKTARAGAANAHASGVRERTEATAELPERSGVDRQSGVRGHNHAIEGGATKGSGDGATREVRGNDEQSGEASPAPGVGRGNGDAKSYAPPLPDAPELAKVLRDTFARQMDDVMAQCRTKAFAASLATKDDRNSKPKPPPTIDLSGYDARLAKAAEPVILKLAKQAARALTIPGVKLPADVFKVVDAKLPEAVADLSLKFARSTNATTSLKLNQALSQLRTDIEEGITEGDTLPKMQERVQAVFTEASADRADMIAKTEASRARHRAEIMTAKESGVVVKKQWLASADACPLCDAVAAKTGDGIPLDEPYATGEGEYGTVQEPPLHPRCQCSQILVTDENA